MVDFIKKSHYSYEDLLHLVSILRSENGCPWDRVQTHGSIRRNFLEEAYEACEGIDLDDPALMAEEFGDVLLQVVFHTDIERDRGRFTMEDVVDGVCKKLVFRHPHLFADCSVENWDWEEMKKQEKGTSTQAQAMEAVARSLPALIRAEKLQKKAAKAGCTWASPQQALSAVRTALDQLETTGSSEALGRALLALTGAAAAMELDAETALQTAGNDLIRRFTAEEQAAAAENRPVSPLSVILES